MNLSETRALRAASAGSGIILLILLAVLTLVIASCDDDNSPCSGKDQGCYSNSINNGLVFEYADETEIEMGHDYAACCGPWEAGYDDRIALKLFFYNIDEELSFWKIFISVNEAYQDSIYSLPLSSSPLKIFLVDISAGNELSGDTPESSGTITLDSFSCGPPLKVSFTIDALVGSEFSEGEPVYIRGNFSCTVYKNLSPFGCDFSL